MILGPAVTETVSRYQLRTVRIKQLMTKPMSEVGTHLVCLVKNLRDKPRLRHKNVTAEHYLLPSANVWNPSQMAINLNVEVLRHSCIVPVVALMTLTMFNHALTQSSTLLLRIPKTPTRTLRCHEELLRGSSNGQDLYPGGDHLLPLTDSALPLDKKATVVIVDKHLSSKGHRLGVNQAMNTRVAKDRHHPAEGEVTTLQSGESYKTQAGEDRATNMLPLGDKRASTAVM